MVKGRYFLCLACLSGGLWAGELVDPTAPKQVQTKAQSSARVAASLPQLQSILFQANHKSVVINNQTYRTGEVVAGYRITSIQANHVFLQRNGKTTKLSLFNADFLK